MQREPKIQKAISCHELTMRLREAEETIARLTADNVRLRDEVNGLHQAEMDMFLDAALAGHQEFIAALRERKIKLPSAEESTIDTRILASILARHGVLGNVLAKIEAYAAAKPQTETERLSPYKYKPEIFDAIEEAFIEVSSLPSTSILAAEEAERRVEIAERRRREVYDEMLKATSDVSNALSIAYDEHKKKTEKCIGGLDGRIASIFHRVQKEVGRDLGKSLVNSWKM